MEIKESDLEGLIDTLDLDVSTADNNPLNAAAYRAVAEDALAAIRYLKIF